MGIFDKFSLKALYLFNLAFISFGALMVLGFYYNYLYINTKIETYDQLISVRKEFNTPEPTIIPSPTPMAAPVKIQIPKLSIETDIVEVGVITGSNEMEVPANGDLVGWYKGSVSPGDIGSSIFTAHYDLPGGAPAIFYSLERLEIGDEIYVINEANKKIYFQVIELINEPISDFPIDKIYDGTDFSKISLITCSGVWNSNLGIYSHRLAVIGELKEISTNKDLLTAFEEMGNNIYLMEMFDQNRQKRQEDLSGPYLRLERFANKLSLYLATDNQEVFAVSAKLNFDENIIKIEEDKTMLSSDFVSYKINKESGEFNISLYTDLSKYSQKTVNTFGDEIKVAEIEFVKLSDKQTQVEISRDSLILPVPMDRNMHQAKNITLNWQGVELD